MSRPVQHRRFTDEICPCAPPVKMLVPIIDEAPFRHFECLRKLRLLCEFYPFAQPRCHRSTAAVPIVRPLHQRRSPLPRYRLGRVAPPRARAHRDVQPHFARQLVFTNRWSGPLSHDGVSCGRFVREESDAATAKPKTPRWSARSRRSLTIAPRDRRRSARRRPSRSRTCR